MGVAERRAREKEELRQRIVEAATQLFVEEGYSNVSIRRIADKIEYAPSTIYLYFKDKSELINEIIHETFLKLSAALDEIHQANLPLLDSMRKSLRCYIDFGLRHPHHYVITFCTPEQQYPHEAAYCEPQIDAAAMECFAKLREGLRECMHAGVIRPADPETIAQMVWMLIHGTTSLLITSPTFPWVDRETLIETALDHVLRSLRP